MFNFFKKKEKASIERRTELRVKLNPLAPIFIKVKTNTSEYNFEILDVSRSGLRVAIPDSWKENLIGKKISGDFYNGITEEPIPISIGISWVREKQCGGIVFGPNKFFQAWITYMFEKEVTAFSLAKINLSLMATEEEGKPWWFKNEAGLELFFVEKKQKIQRFHIYLLDSVIDYYLGNTVNYIFTDYSREIPLLVPKQAIEQACVFVQSAVDIPLKLKESIILILKKTKMK